MRLFIYNPLNPLSDPTAALWQMVADQQETIAEAESAIDMLDAVLGDAAALIREMREQMLMTGIITDSMMDRVNGFLNRLSDDKFERTE